MSRSQPPLKPGVTAERFARVFVPTAAWLPKQADSRYDADRGYYFKLYLDNVAPADAGTLVAKARERFDVELVRRVQNGSVAKERRYVAGPDEVPDEYTARQGPQGGWYYETAQRGDVRATPEWAENWESLVQDPDAVPDEEVVLADYELAAGWEPFDGEPEDLLELRGVTVEAFDGEEFFEAIVDPDGMSPVVEDPRGDRYLVPDEAVVTAIEESAEPSDEKGEGGVTTGTAGVHSARYSREGEEEYNFPEPAIDLDEVGKFEKQGDPWVQYTGPQGGTGWVNRQTGEVRYQEEHPGQVGEGEEPTPDGPGVPGEDFDPAEPPEDGYGRGWDGPPEDLGDLDVGQPIEFYDDGYGYAEVVDVTESEVVAESEGGERFTLEPDQVTAAGRSVDFSEGVPEVEIDATTPEAFNEAVTARMEEDEEMGAFLTEHPPEELAEHTLLTTEDGLAGAAVSPEGDIQNVFALEAAESGSGRAVFEAAIENGGITLDCYDGFLRDMYADFGFRETGRMEFNPEFAPEGFNLDKYGHPDVVFMHLDPEAPLELEDTYYDGDEWGDAKQDSRRAARPRRDGGAAGGGVRGGERGPDTGSGEAGRRDIEVLGEPSELLEDLGQAGGFTVEREVPEHLQDILGETEEEVSVEFEPRGDPADDPWGETPGTPLHAHPGSYGNSAIDVEMSVEDFADLQEYLGTRSGPEPSDDPEAWWDQAADEYVDQYARFLTGEEEPEDYVEGGLAIPFVVIGADGRLRDVQEGRHRTLAAQRAGLDSIPVRIYQQHDREGEDEVRPAEADEDEAPNGGSDSTVAASASMVKQGDVWVSYVGPQGGQGWMNMATGEIRYQAERPGPGPEDFEEEPMAEGWAEPPDDLEELQTGQEVEFFETIDEEYYQGRFVDWDEDNLLVEEEDGTTHTVQPGEVTAVEADYDMFDPWYESEKAWADSPEEYWGYVEDEPNAATPDYYRDLRAGDVVHLDPDHVGIIDEPMEIELQGFFAEDSPASAGEPVVDTRDVPFKMETFGPDNPVSPGTATGTANVFVETQDTDGPEDLDQFVELAVDEWPSNVHEGMPLWYQSQSMDEPRESEIKLIDDDGSVLTEHDDWVWPESMDVWVHESAFAGPGTEGSVEEDPSGPEDETPPDAPSEPAYDFAEYEPADVEEWGDLSDFGFPGGVSVHAMRVGALPHWDGESNDGLVFATEYGEGHSNKAKPGLGKRQMATYHVSKALGGNVPTHKKFGPDWETFEVHAEGVEGEMAGSAPPELIEQVDEDDFYEQAAIQIICGNNDAHVQNVLIEPDGSVNMIDIDHSAGDITSDFVGNKPSYESAIDRTLGELYRTADALDLGPPQQVKQEMLDRAEQFAYQVMDGGEQHERFNEALEEVQAIDEEFAGNIAGNMTALAEGEVTWP